MARRRKRVLVVTWGSGGNLPPLLAAGGLLRSHGCQVEVLTSAATREQAQAHGFATVAYGRAPDPDTRVPFEAQAQRLLAQAAGLELARDVQELALERSAGVVVADCMLPAALAGAEAAGARVASVVHFPYAFARAAMARHGGSWTTDRATLDETRRQLGLPPTAGNIEAWESPDLLLVTLPRWFDASGKMPAHVLHAGPLGVRSRSDRDRAHNGRRALLAFSTTVMDGQPQLIASAGAAVEEAGIEGVLTLGGALDRSLIGEIPAVEVMEWADHDALMAQCDVVVTHAGLGTTLRALAHGVPLVMLPLGRDQHFNASRARALGAGLHLPADADAHEIADAIYTVVTKPRFRQSAGVVAHAIAAERADQVAAEALLRLTVTRWRR